MASSNYKGIKNEKPLIILENSNYYKALAREIIKGEESLAQLIKINDPKTFACNSYDGGGTEIEKAISIINRCKAIIRELSHEHVEEEQEEEEEEQEEEEPFPSDDLHLPLPLHVAMKIFAHLPIRSIAQIRLVSKSWNSLLSSSSFLFNLEQERKVISHNGHCSSELWFVLAASTTATSPHSHDFLAFSYPLWKPFRLPLHASPKLGDLLLRVASSQSLVPSVVNLLVASAGGLMCAVVKGAPLGFTQQKGGSPSFISELTYDMVVFNCLTGELKTLPRPARLANKLISSCMLSMRAEAATNEYGIILCDTKYREMEIYDSQTGSWRAGAGIRSSSEANPSASMSADMSIADVLENDVIRYHKEELAAYNVQKDCWRKAEVALPRIAATELLRSTVVKCDGGVYLVACLMKQAVRMEGYGVWELREGVKGSFKWAEIGRTPAGMVAEFGRTKFGSPAFYDCRFVGGMKSNWVCMTGVHYTIGSGTRAEYWPPLLFNVRLQQWQLLPARPCLCLFPLEPRFTAPV